MNYNLNTCNFGPCINQAQPSDFALSQSLQGLLSFQPTQAFATLQVTLATNSAPSDFKDFSISLALASNVTVGIVNSSISTSLIRIAASADARGLITTKNVR